MSFSGTKGYITKPKQGVQINPLHPLSRGLVGYWLFNEGSGSRAYDISGKGNHGTLTNMSPNAQGSGWSGSRFGGNLSFDGTDDYIDCGSGFALPTTFTIILWVKANSYLNLNYVFWRDDDRPGIRMNDLGNWWFATDGNNANQIDSSAVVSIGKWDHLVYIFNGSVSTAYVNGINVGSRTDSTYTQGTSVRIGGDNNPARHFNGSVDSVRIYNRTLSAFEVKQLYHDPFCNLMQVPIRRHSVAAPPIGAIINQFQRANIGADLYNGVFA